MMSPYWRNVRNTAYSRALLRSVRDLYGVQDISEKTYRELSRKIQAANRPGWYKKSDAGRRGHRPGDLGHRVGGAKLDPSLFRAVIRFDDFAVGALHRSSASSASRSKTWRIWRPRWIGLLP